MELRSLRSLVEVARQGGFSKASDVLFSTQSTVSKAIKTLEDELGIQLLERSGKTVRLTDAGSVVFKGAEQMLAIEANIHAQLEDLMNYHGGTLRLGLPLTSCTTVFSEWFIEYRKRYPGLDVTLREADPQTLERMLRSGEIHIAVSTLPVADDLCFIKIRRDEIVAAVTADNPLAAKGAIHLRELLGVPLITADKSNATDRLILTACRDCGFAPTVIARCSQADSIISLAAGGFGVGLIPASVMRHKTGTGTIEVKISEPRIVFDLGLVWRKDSYLPFAARAALSIFPLPGWA